MAVGPQKFRQRCAFGPVAGGANHPRTGPVRDFKLSGRRSGAGAGIAAASFRRNDAGLRAPHLLLSLREREPILRLPKSALVTVYPLPDARLLMVVNIHAVNFSLGVDVYSKQLLPIGDQIAHHSGPVIMAGDFNASEPAADECAVPLCA